MPFHRDVWWLLGSVAAAITAAPLIVHGDAETTARRKAAAQKIEQLSPAERKELEENFKRFEKLPPTDQAKYRDMHAKLQQNPAVNEALDTFSHWWGNVSAREQGDVFSRPEVKQRIAAVGQIQDQIDNTRGGRMSFGRGFGRDGFQMGPPLPREAFYQIMQTMEAMAANSLSIEKELPEIRKLDEKNPLRYQKLLIALHDHKQKWSTLVPNLSAENEIVQAISDEKTKEMVQSRMGGRGSAGKNFWIRWHLTVALGKELVLEGLKQKFGEEDLQKRLANLSDDEKAEFYSLPGDDGRMMLKMRLFRDEWKDSQAVLEFFELTGFGRGGFGSGPPGGRGGDGQPGRGEPGRGEPGRGEGRGEPGREPPPPRRPD